MNDDVGRSGEIDRLKKKYPELVHVWEKRMTELHGGEIDLRQHALDSWRNHDALLWQAILNDIKWVEQNNGASRDSELSLGVMRRSDGKICGYDFLVGSPLEIPCMCPGATFPMRYAHVLPAMMLANFLKNTQTGLVETTVVCQGRGVETDDVWWYEDAECRGTAATAADSVVESAVFQSYLNKVKVKSMRRICAWVLCVRHVFMVVWEQGDCHDVIYFADNAVGDKRIDAFRNDFLNRFRDLLDTHRISGVTRRELFTRSVFSTSHVAIQPDLMCVSFMARCTAYLNTMHTFCDGSAVKFIVDMLDVRSQAFCYSQFESALSRFLADCLLGDGSGSASKCVWLPGAMRDRFVNINDVCLMVFNPRTSDISKATRFEFFFDPVPSFKAVSADSDESGLDIDLFGGGCRIASESVPMSAAYLSSKGLHVIADELGRFGVALQALVNAPFFHGH
jgi:hypothetical protein